MSSISGYRAVVEACNVYGRLLMGQITAAGRVQPSKVRYSLIVPFLLLPW
jgi:NAD(P) transhydrogenase subunit alpha